MRSFILLLTLSIAALLCSACGSSNQSNSAVGPQPLPATTVKQPPQSTATNPTNDAPVAVAHGGAPPSSGSPGSVDTSAPDKKIEQAEAKAKAPGATQADKLAAATAYLERANIFYNAGQPMLYKFALRDFRYTLRYDPNNAEAREKQDQIVQIYQQMGRPVPELGNEP